MELNSIEESGRDSKVNEAVVSDFLQSLADLSFFYFVDSTKQWRPSSFYPAFSAT